MALPERQGTITLAALREGDQAEVVALEDAGGGLTGVLVSWGVLPGVTVTLVQRSPAFVFRLGHGEFAVDRELANRIRVAVTRGASDHAIQSCSTRLRDLHTTFTIPLDRSHQ